MTRELKVVAEVKIPIPEDATHFGVFDDKVIFYKNKKIGVVGDHWYSMRSDGIWHFYGHNKPNWAKELPENLTIQMPDSWLNTEDEE